MKNNKLLSEAIKLDLALTPASLNGAGTGDYYRMDQYGKALFLWETGAMAAAATSIGQVMQAQDAAGTGAKVITNNAATITANTKVAALTITCATVIATDEVTVNGLTFVAAAAEDLPNRKFAVGANDTACAASLVKAINHASAGVPGITATSALGVVTLNVNDPGEVVITASSPDATITVATLRAIGYVECDALFLDDGFTHVALRVTNSAATQTGAVLLRGQGRFSPVQKAAAAKTNVSA